MAHTSIETSQAALSLPLDERAALAHALIQSLDVLHDPEVEQAWDQEIEKRIERYEKGQVASRDAFTALEDLKSRYSA